MSRILIFGDSITWGAVDPEGMGWANRLQKHFYNTTEGDVSVYNLGISGDRTEDLLKRIQAECEAREFEASITAIVIAMGINDSRYVESKESPEVSIERFKANLSEIKEIGHKFTKNIVFVGLTNIDESKTMPIPWDTTRYYNSENVETYNSTIKAFCDKEDMPFIELSNTVDTQDLYDDGLHPNSEGHRKIFEKVKDELEKLGYIS